MICFHSAQEYPSNIPCRQFNFTLIYGLNSQINMVHNTLEIYVLRVLINSRSHINYSEIRPQMFRHKNSERIN